VTPLICFVRSFLDSWACCCYELSSYVCCYHLLLCIESDHLCKVWETSTCRDSSQREWYKEEQCGTQVSSLDHLRGVECNPWPKEVTTTWSRHWANHRIKSLCLMCIYFIAIVCVFIVTLVIAPKFDTHLKGAIKWRVLFLSISIHHNLVLAFTNTRCKPSLSCLELIFAESPIHLL
jgi:hypothetical protein